MYFTKNDFSYLPTSDDFKNVDRSDYSLMNDIAYRIAHGTPMSDETIKHDLWEATMKYYKCGVMNDGRYAIIYSISDIIVEVSELLTVDQFQSLSISLINQILLMVISEARELQAV